MTKDYDFCKLLELKGPPPSIIWITYGNSSNARMREILGKNLRTAINIINSGETLVELGEV